MGMCNQSQSQSGQTDIRQNQHQDKAVEFCVWNDSCPQKCICGSLITRVATKRQILKR